MNIFWLDENPSINVTYYVDKHVSKIRTEIAQMLCTALCGHKQYLPIGATKSLYKPTHGDHPVTRWISESERNFNEALNLAYLLEAERAYRFGAKETKTPKVLDYIRTLLLSHGANILWPHTRSTPRPIVVAEDCLIEHHCVESYRMYYNKHKSHLFKWTNRERPKWTKN